MKRYLLPILILVAAARASASTTPDPAAQTLPVPAAAPVRAAAERGIKYLQTEGPKWKEVKDCASCHHIPTMIWTLGEAKTGGYAIDEKALADMTPWAFAENDGAKVLPSPNAINMASVYLLLGAKSLPEGGRPSSAQLKRFVEHILSKQETVGPDEGAWISSGPPPVGPGPEAATLFVRLALDSLPLDAVPDQAALAEGRRKADDWLARTPPGDLNQTLDLRLWLDLVSGREKNELQPSILKITAMQNPDGGWSQTSEMPGDAYATGQTLYVLMLAGIPFDDPALLGGLKFLTSTQREDGSWPMTSRKAAVTHLEPITYAAAGWAVMALMRATVR